MTEEEDCLLLLDPIASLQDDDDALFEDDEAFPLLELDGDPGTESGMTTLEEEGFLTEEEEAFEELLLVLPASPFLLLLEGRFPLEVGMTEEEDEDETYSSLFEEVPLSPPQANKEAQSAMLATTKMQLFKNDNLKSLINTPTTGKIYNFPIDGIYLTPS
jgi:hypothetical protein